MKYILMALLMGLCLLLGCVMALSVLRLLTPVQQLIGASQAIARREFDTPDVPVPHQDEMGQLAEAFNHMRLEEHTSELQSQR